METKRKTLTINLTEEEHREAKIAAAKAGKTMREIFMEAIAKLIEAQKQNNG